jgi:RNA polymerase sigma-32 factor
MMTKKIINGQLHPLPLDKKIKLIAYKSDFISISEEYRLFESYKKGCIKSYNKLFNSHLRLVYKIARKFSKNNYTFLEDLISEGTLGLVVAIKKLDIKKARLCTYAVPWILYYIETYYIKNCFGNISISRDSKTKQIFYELKKIGKDKLTIVSEKDINLLAKKFSVHANLIKDIIFRILEIDLFEISNKIHNGDKTLKFTDVSLESEKKLNTIAKIVSDLKPLHKRIFISRKYHSKSLKEIAKQENISVQRVSFIDNKCIENIKKTLKIKNSVGVSNA